MKHRLDAVDHSGFEVKQQSTRDVVLVISLVEEHVLAVAAVRREILQDPVRADAVLGAQLLPELRPNCTEHACQRLTVALR